MNKKILFITAGVFGVLVIIFGYMIIYIINAKSEPPIINTTLANPKPETPVTDTDKKPAAFYQNIAYYRDMTKVRSLKADKIIVVRNDKCDKNPRFDGNYDHIQDVLTTLNIPHTLIGKSELEKDSYTLDDKWALIFNSNFFKEHCCSVEHAKMKSTGRGGTEGKTSLCPGKDNHEIHNTKLSDKTIQKIKQFVEIGGYLFTEDLNIEEIIERAFKGTIVHREFLPERNVQIMPATNAASHQFLKYVFELPPNPPNYETPPVNWKYEWRIADESPDIKILNKDKVTILIISPGQARRQKNEGAVAVTFGSGKGKVLHIMTHFCAQCSKLDEFTLQNLMVNFLEECGQW